MKKIIFTFLLIGFASLSNAQTYTVPAASPQQTIEQQFSISNIKIEYSRPAVKGRKIFGELVPFGKVWRAGANAATKITLNQKVIFGNKVVNSGEYALFIIPEAKNWKIILNKNANTWGSYTYDEKMNVAEVEVSVQNLIDLKEYFEIKLEPKSEDSLDLVLSWEKTKVIVPVQAHEPESVKKITKLLQEVKQIQRDANKK